MIIVTFGKDKGTVKYLISELLKNENIDFNYTDKNKETKILLLDAPQKNCQNILLKEHNNTNIDTDFCILIDADLNLKISKDNKSILISYGLNPLSTAIISSMQTTNSGICFHFCLQRQIKTIKGQIIEPGEFPVTINKKDISINDALAFCLLALILEIPKEKISLN